MSSIPTRPGAALVNALVLFLALIWGSTWLVIRNGLTDLPPLLSAGARFAVAGVVMAALAPVLARREGGARPSLGLVVAMGVFIFGLSYGVLYWCETVLPSGLVCVLWAVYPLMLAAGAGVVLPSERLAARQWGGMLAGLAGVVLLFATDVASLGTEALSVGLVLLLSPLFSMIGTLWVKRDGEHASSVLLNRDGMLLGGALLLAASLVLERDRDVRWTSAALGSVAYLALVGTVTAFGIYFWLLRYAPATKLALISYMTPVIALTLGARFGNEPVGANTLLGTALVLVGVGFAGRRSRAARAVTVR